VNSESAGVDPSDALVSVLLSDQATFDGGVCLPYDVPILAHRLFLFVFFGDGGDQIHPGTYAIEGHGTFPFASLLWDVHQVGPAYVSGSLSGSVAGADGGIESIVGTFSAPVCVGAPNDAG
jgi:hypothetical protein